MTLEIGDKYRVCQKLHSGGTVETDLQTPPLPIQASGDISEIQFKLNAWET